MRATPSCGGVILRHPRPRIDGTRPVHIVRCDTGACLWHPSILQRVLRCDALRSVQQRAEQRHPCGNGGGGGDVRRCSARCRARNDRPLSPLPPGEALRRAASARSSALRDLLCDLQHALLRIACDRVREGVDRVVHAHVLWPLPSSSRSSSPMAALIGLSSRACAIRAPHGARHSDWRDHVGSGSGSASRQPAIGALRAGSLRDRCASIVLGRDVRC